MKTIDTTATVTDDNMLVVKITPDIAPGQHRVVLVIDETPAVKPSRSAGAFPVISVGRWPEDLSLRREDMYGDDGR